MMYIVSAHEGIRAIIAGNGNSWNTLKSSMERWKVENEKENRDCLIDYENIYSRDQKRNTNIEKKWGGDRVEKKSRDKWKRIEKEKRREEKEKRRKGKEKRRIEKNRKENNKKVEEEERIGVKVGKGREEKRIEE